ncbi:MAG: HAD hydrolase-like protein [Deltaproteobacteria bacterium]|nr:HAD hydrolase-like protein [Deltaproteobacteria bacterium]
MIENILFDLDGTLTDSKVGIIRSIQFSLEHFDVAVPDENLLTWCIGPPLKDSFSQILKTTDNSVLEKALSRYRKRYAETGIFENRVYPGVASSLQKIHQSGFRMFLATAKPQIFAKQILDHFNLSHFFTAIYGSELDGRLTDKSELITHILDTERLDPQVSLIVGDRIHDLAGGKENGLITAAATYGYGSPEEIDSAGPDIFLNTFTDLLSFLKTPAITDQAAR